MLKKSNTSNKQTSSDYLSLCVKRRHVNHDHGYTMYVNPTPDVINTSNFGSGILPVMTLHMCSQNHRPQESRNFSDVYGFEEYRDDIFRYKLKTEEMHLPFQCLKNQPQIHELLRAILIRWLTEIHHRMNLCQETLFLTVNILDRFLARMVIIPESLQMIGLTSLLIASKYEEMSPPDMNELLTCVDMRKIHRSMMKRLECIILKALSFSLSHPSALYFIEYYAAICMEMSDSVHIGKLKKSVALSRLILEVSLQDYHLCQFKPSLLSLCTWLLSISENGYRETHNFFIPKEHCEKVVFDNCFSKVQQHMSNLRCQYPNIDSLCNSYN